VVDNGLSRSDVKMVSDPAVVDNGLSRSDVKWVSDPAVVDNGLSRSDVKWVSDPAVVDNGLSWNHTEMVRGIDRLDLSTVQNNPHPLSLYLSTTPAMVPGHGVANNSHSLWSTIG
jgi:hypothetical protein